MADADHPDAGAIAEAKKILAAMIDEAATRPADDGSGTSATMTPADLWISIATYNINTKTASSYIITPRDLDDDHTRQQQTDSVNADVKGKKSKFDIVLATSFEATWTVSDTVTSYFDAATQKWSTVITGDLMDIPTGVLAGTPTSGFGGFFGSCTYPESIDDLYICASAADLGGPIL